MVKKTQIETLIVERRMDDDVERTMSSRRLALLFDEYRIYKYSGNALGRQMPTVLSGRQPVHYLPSIKVI